MDIGVADEVLVVQREVPMSDLLWLASAADDASARYTLGCVAVDLRYMVASDGRRLHAIAAADVSVDPGRVFLIPLAAIQAMRLLAGHNVTVTVSGYDNDRIVLSALGAHVMVKSVEGRFPMVAELLSRPKVTVTDRLVKDIRKVCRTTEVDERIGIARAAVLGAMMDPRLVIDAIKPMDSKANVERSDGDPQAAVYIVLDESRHAVVMPCEKT